MTEAASHLIGLHDFAAFCRPRDYGTTIRTLLTCTPVRLPATSIALTVEADAFCHSMVRSLTGALVSVGRHQRDLTWIDALLTATARAGDIPVMPAGGLTLEEVTYPDEDGLADRAAQARARRDEETP
jgi:tRNA pseudouridine38-40 synthase